MSNSNIEKYPRLPRHIAIIMDGNGRWATQRGLPRITGHKEGVRALQDIIKEANEFNVQVLTVYAFSSENWNRPRTEVSLLMELFMTTLKQGLYKLHENKVKLGFIGDHTQFPQKLQRLMREAVELTEHNSGLKLNVAANYGGRWDITNAIKKILMEAKTREIDPADIDDDYVQSYLSLTDQPAPDLFIRTGGEMRISNFLLWQLAYTELYFTETLWPDFSAREFKLALDWYATRERRFGRTSEQLGKLNSA